MSATTTTAGIDRDAVYRKISWRLLPFVLACYVVNYLDRVSIGYGKLQTEDVVDGLRGVKPETGGDGEAPASLRSSRSAAT